MVYFVIVRVVLNIICLIAQIVVYFIHEKVVVRRARNILQTIYREFETLLIIGHAWRILPN